MLNLSGDVQLRAGGPMSPAPERCPSEVGLANHVRWAKRTSSNTDRAYHGVRMRLFIPSRRPGVCFLPKWMGGLYCLIRSIATSVQAGLAFDLLIQDDGSHA